MKVCVVGASVAGLHVAQFLLSSDLDVDVKLFEHKNVVGENIICGGAIASFMLKQCGIEIPKEFVAARIRNVRFYPPSYEYAELEMRKEYGLILWRGQWEKWLEQQIKKFGGKFHFNVRNPLSYFPDADVIVGADGITGITRRVSGLPVPPREDIHIAAQGIYKLTQHPEDTISLFFSNRLARGGYGWIFPQGDGEFRVGLGVPLSVGEIVAFYDRFLADLECVGMAPVRVERMKVKLIPTTKPPKTNVKGIFAFIGDAGLFTDAATGGGIGPAVLSAKCLAEALGKGGLKDYDRIWKSKLYRRNSTRYKLKQVLVELSDAEWEMIIGKLCQFKPWTESIGWELLHLVMEIAATEPQFLVKHKVLRRLLR